MSIKIITEIPKPGRERSASPVTSQYREQLYRDLESAYINGIAKFEFTDYDAKPDYLAALAREEAFKVCEKYVYAPAKEYVIRKLKKEFPKDIHIYVPLPDKYSPNHIIKISGVTLEDGVKHIYGEIDFKYAKGFKKDRVDPARYKTGLRMTPKNALSCERV